LKKYMRIQKKKIEVDKWNEGCRIQQDPGHTYIINWIETQGSWFRKSWEKSKCKECSFCEQCGYKLLRVCDKFVSDQYKKYKDFLKLNFHIY
jgi:hypothetical protein